MRLGFVGTGAIAKALVVGLLDGDPGDIAVVLSPRNATTAAALAARFPAAVTVAASNQAVLDACDVAILAVRPPDLGAALSALRFRPDHLVLSLVATASAEELARLVRPATRIVRAIPLPSAADRASPTPITPPDPVVRALFDRVGVAVETADLRAFQAMTAASGTMAGTFAAASVMAGWLADRGLEVPQAETYVRLLLLGLAGEMQSGHASFETMAREHTTEGGLNAQFRAHLSERGVEDIIRLGLDALLARIARTPTEEDSSRVA